MLLKEFLDLNANDDCLGIYLDGTDGFNWFYKKDIPNALKNRKIRYWKTDGNEDLTITIEGKIFADGNE